MVFEFHPFMLMFVALGGFGLFIALNREKVRDFNKKWDERSNLPKFFQRSRWDPEGRLNQIGGAGMAIIAVAAILAMGFGAIDT